MKDANPSKHNLNINYRNYVNDLQFYISLHLDDLSPIQSLIQVISYYYQVIN